MAYVALLDLSQTLEGYLKRYDLHPLLKQKIVALKKNVSALMIFLEDYSHKSSGAVNPLEDQILTAAYHADNIIGDEIDHFDYSPSLLPTSWLDKLMPESERKAQKLLQNTEVILKEAMKIENNAPVVTVSLPGLSDAPSLSTDTSSDVNTMVFQGDFILIKERVYNRSCPFSVIPIVGMGGIGKSTLARRLYEDSIKQRYFDRCLWIVVSQDYSLNKILLDMILSMEKGIDKDKEYTNAKLVELIHKELFSRRYLVVIDDLWSKKAWDDLNSILPRDTAGSRILVTTRLSEVASHVGSPQNPPHEVKLLNEQQSWELFEERVFGKGFSCPSELEQIGKKVVGSCKGLPLTIAVIAGLLKGDTAKEYWDIISENISSSEPAVALHCSKVLSLSYKHLPLYLRPCFLYVTAFPEDSEIKANSLIRLWMGEGFVKPRGSKLLEEVAQGYLHDLVGRNLLKVVSRGRYNNKIKTIAIHDVLRDFGASIAQHERFQYHDDLKCDHRRVFINNHDSLDLLGRFSAPEVRSVLIRPYVHGSHQFQNLRLLRVLDSCKIHMEGKADRLVHLRYLAITYVDHIFLKSTFRLRNLQTLIVQHGVRNFVIPSKVWTSPSLRHLILLSEPMLLAQPSGDDFEESNLQIIRTVSNLRFTVNVLEMLRNLRKLNLYYDEKAENFDLANLVKLQKLEKLSVKFLFSAPIDKLDYPISLKKLSLTNFEGYFTELSVVGALPNLEVFELIGFYNRWIGDGGGWEPIEGQFLKLKHLRLEELSLECWEAESVHFPSLESLYFKKVYGLNEIPSGIGEIDTLKVIKLFDCWDSTMDSAKQIQADQWGMGKTNLQLFISNASENSEVIEKFEEITPEEH